ncbi:MAG: gamma-glutamylcyclotransferase family protein [bacterium]
MFKVAWFEDCLLDVVCPEGRRVTRKTLDDPRATFVWGKLMDPAFIAKLVGRPAPFCAAEIRGYERVKTPEFYALRKKAGATTQGVVLLGLTDNEIDALNAFEQIPDVMERRRIEASMGVMKRQVYFYIKRGTR